jgi:hypothetical protein
MHVSNPQLAVVTTVPLTLDMNGQLSGSVTGLDDISCSGDPMWQAQAYRSSGSLVWRHYYAIAGNAWSIDTATPIGYVQQGGGIVVTGVQSFKGRQGAVIPAPNDYGVNDINGLSYALSTKFDVNTSIPESQVNNLVNDLAGKAAAVHTHVETDVANLTTDLAGKAALVHTHAQTDVIGLAAALATKAADNTVVHLTDKTGNGSGVASVSGTPSDGCAAWSGGNLVNGGSGCGTAISANGVALLVQGSVNFLNGNSISITNPSGNSLRFDVTSVAESQVTNLVSDLAGKAPTVHTHTEAQVTNLTADLAATEKSANKGAASGYAPLDSSSKVPATNLPSLPESQITNLVSDLASKAPAAGIAEGAVTNLVADLASKAPATGIAESAITSLVSDLAGKAPTSHTHTEAQVTSLTTDLAARALSSITISGANSVAGGGDLSANRTLALVNDVATPGNGQFYGTNSSGVRGWYTLPAGFSGSYTGDSTFTGNMTVTKNLTAAGFVSSGTGPFLLSGIKQTSTPLVPTGLDFNWYVGSDNKSHCQLSAALGGGACDAGISNPMTSAYDLIVGGTSGVPTRLATAVSSILTTTSGGVETWVTAISSGQVTGLGALATLNVGAGLTSSSGSLTTVGQQPHIIAPYVPGTFTASQKLYGYKASLAYTVPASCTNSWFTLDVAPTTAVSFLVQRQGTTFGTIAVSSGSTTGSFTCGSATSFAVGDVLTLVGPSTADGTSTYGTGGQLSLYSVR